MIRTSRARRTVLGVVGLGLAATACTSSTLSVAGTSSASPSSSVSGSGEAPKPFATLPSIRECEKLLGSPCYTLEMVRKAYGIDRLHAQGLTGKGRTIAIYTVNAPPTLHKDLEKFSTSMKLPKPNLTIRRLDTGIDRAPFDADNQQMVTAATETTLDVQTAHMMAPDAKIVVAELGFPRSPSSSPTGSTSPQPQDHGLPYLPPDVGLAAGRALSEVFPAAFAGTIQQDNPDVISVSYAAQEYQAAGDTGEPVAAFKKASKDFAGIVRSGTTLVSAAGDWGAAPTIGKGNTRVKSVSWPASDPHFVSVGGSRLHLDAHGKRTTADTVWNDSTVGKGATGGGPSQTFPRPAYQDSVSAATGQRRGTPDLSMNGSATAGTLIYQSYHPAGKGWITIGGSSEATPLFAAVVALANEKAGKRLGDIHPALYALAARPDGGIVDITEGNNGPDGFQATKGYDLASGVGTIDAATFVPALAANS
ncbi:S8 family serine peptidase [Streptomyces sp. NPDC001978]|uniref:S53 family peptidase n=1 Tax=Streptomyces sp. NPDC001978 TaxID=3364627 RepID=UPI0036742BDB